MENIIKNENTYFKNIDNVRKGLPIKKSDSDSVTSSEDVLSEQDLDKSIQIDNKKLPSINEDDIINNL